MGKLAKLVSELRRRRVFRVAGLYVIGAWMFLQVADLVFASWGIRPEALRFIWIGAMVGFPIALVIGWRYDFVGGRLVHATASQLPTDLSLHRTDYLILGALVVLIGATLFGIGSKITDLRTSETDNITTARFDPKSIAILPFADLSADRSPADFLAIGIQDGLLTSLSRIAALKVISRTSTERYRNSTKAIPEIGRELGVGRILEGSVQRAGDRLRVNVQLIDSSSDEHLWASTYDRTMTASNVFSIQTDIVESIAAQLRTTLTPRESSRLLSEPTRNTDAYTAYLRGRQQAEIESVESLNSALGFFTTAIELDPVFALAHLALADTYLTLSANFYGAMPSSESTVLAEPPLARALELDPSLGEAYATLGLLREQQGRLPAAEQAYEKAIEMHPGYARSYRLYGRLRWLQGRNEEGLVFAKRALELDPFSATLNFDVARHYDEAGRFDDAMAQYLRVVDIEPQHAFAYVYIAAIHYLVYGQVDESLVWYHKAAENDAMSPNAQAVPAIAYLELGDPESANVWIERGMQLGPDTFFSLYAQMLRSVYLGDDAVTQQSARALLEAYPQSRDGLHFLRNADLVAGRYDVARARYARAHPELVDSDPPNVNAFNLFAAIDLAYVYVQLGEQNKADELLQRGLETTRTMSRLGTVGYWIADARIYATQNRTDQAVDALSQAIDQGWRVLSWYHLRHDPNLESVRHEPKFQVLREKVEADLAMQAKRMRELRASGDLATVRITDRTPKSSD